jgi:ABC-type nitrate/sulfonate/bicarbonate transport system substrate-binding protein
MSQPTRGKAMKGALAVTRQIGLTVPAAQVAGLLAALLLAVGTTALAHEMSSQMVHLICLPDTPLPVVVAQTHGIFAKYGIMVNTEKAKDADQVRRSLVSGKADIAEASVEIAVAMADSGQADAVIIMGGEGSTSELIVQPGIKSISDLRGKTIILDGPDTAQTLSIKNILLLHGLKPGVDCELGVIGLAPDRLQAMLDHKEYAATIEKPPNSILAKRAGLVSLGSTLKLMGMGQSQGIGAFAQRQWAHQHTDLVERYIAAYVEAQRWLTSPVNKHQAIDLVAKEWKLSPDIAAETYEINVKDSGGWAKEARFSVEGFKNELKLQAEFDASLDGKRRAAEKYYDLSFYQQALSILK